MALPKSFDEDKTRIFRGKSASELRCIRLATAQSIGTIADEGELTGRAGKEAGGPYEFWLQIPPVQRFNVFNILTPPDYA